MTLAANLKKLRHEKGFSQKEMADIFQIPVSSYANWEKGTEPKIHYLILLSEFFNVSVDELIGAVILSPEQKANHNFSLTKKYIEKAGLKITPAKNNANNVIISTANDSNTMNDIILSRNVVIKIILKAVEDADNYKEKLITDRIIRFFYANEV